MITFPDYPFNFYEYSTFDSLYLFQCTLVYYIQQLFEEVIGYYSLFLRLSASRQLSLKHWMVARVLPDCLFFWLYLSRLPLNMGIFLSVKIHFFLSPSLFNYNLALILIYILNWLFSPTCFNLSPIIYDVQLSSGQLKASSPSESDQKTVSSINNRKHESNAPRSPNIWLLLHSLSRLIWGEQRCFSSLSFNDEWISLSTKARRLLSVLNGDLQNNFLVSPSNNLSIVLSPFHLVIRTHPTILIVRSDFFILIFLPSLAI